MWYLVTSCYLPEAGSDVRAGTHLWQIILDSAVHFGYPGLHRCRDIRLKKNAMSFGAFIICNFRPEIPSDVMYGKAVEMRVKMSA